MSENSELFLRDGARAPRISQAAKQKREIAFLF